MGWRILVRIVIGNDGEQQISPSLSDHRPDPVHVEDTAPSCGGGTRAVAGAQHREHKGGAFRDQNILWPSPGASFYARKPTMDQNIRFGRIRGMQRQYQSE